MKKIVNKIVLVFSLLMLSAGSKICLGAALTPEENTAMYQEAVHICKDFLTHCCTAKSQVDSDAQSNALSGLEALTKTENDRNRASFLDRYYTYTTSIVAPANQFKNAMIARIRSLDQDLAKRIYANSILNAMTMLLSAPDLKAAFIAKHTNDISSIADAFFAGLDVNNVITADKKSKLTTKITELLRAESTLLTTPEATAAGRFSGVLNAVLTRAKHSYAGTLAQTVGVTLAAAGTYALDSAMQSMVTTSEMARGIPDFAPTYNVQATDVSELSQVATVGRYALVAAWCAAIGGTLIARKYCKRR
jgi:hypothetical protein